MTAARDIVCKRVVTGFSEERLSDVAARMLDRRAHHCVVVSEDGASFLGLIRIADLARHSDPGNRILADLVSGVSPVTIGASEPATDVATLFEKHALGEAAVFEANGVYVGLVTSESVLEWLRSEGTASRGDFEARSRRTLTLLTVEIRSALVALLDLARSRADHPHLEEGLRRDLEEMAELAEQAITRTDRAVRSMGTSAEPFPTTLARAVLLHPILDQCILRAREPLSAKRLLLSSSWDADNDRVSGDQESVANTFWGILEQAIALAPLGGRLRVESRPGDGGFCQVTVFSAREPVAIPVEESQGSDDGLFDEAMTTVSFALYDPQPPSAR